jgi:hypothetical protein
MDRQIYRALLKSSSDINPLLNPEKLNADELTNEEDLTTLF